MREFPVTMDRESLERALKRIARLKTELDDEGVDLKWDETDPAYTALVEEILYARQPPVHEGRIGSYGAIVIDSSDRLAELNKLTGWALENEIIDLSGEEPQERDPVYVRKACNGRTTFLVRSPRGLECLLELSAQAGEQQLARLTSTRTRVIQRTPGGAVKVFTPDRVYVFEHDAWRAKVYSSDAVRALEQLFFPDGSAGTVQVLNDLLSLCLHVLSSRHIGATFVWAPDPAHPRAGDSRSEAGKSTPARLHVSREHQVEAIATLLAGIDGACLVGPDGEIERIEMRLAATNEAVDCVPAERGLRHTSAKRYSFDDPACLVFVVSHDGPVTVYSDGMSVLELRIGPSHASSIGGVPTHDRFGIQQTVTCRRCRKELVVGRIHVRYQDRSLSIDCPVCETPGLDSDSAFEMHAWPQKPWTSWAAVDLLPE
jgi:DNA integrity scanning protein DisA with diadenylate cyclase activity